MHLHNQCNLKHPREVSNTPCDAITNPVLPPVPLYVGMYQKSSILHIRHFAIQSLYNMSDCSQLLSAFVVAVALTAFSPTSCDLQSYGPRQANLVLIAYASSEIQASLRIRAVSPEPSLLAHTSSESRGTFIQKARSLAQLNGWACAVEICQDGMLEDTNSLDGAQMVTNICSVQNTCRSLNSNLNFSSPCIFRFDTLFGYSSNFYRLVCIRPV